MRTTTEIKIKIVDNKKIKALIDAYKIVDDWTAGPDLIASHMRALFNCEKINQEMIDVYNHLEQRWITLTKFQKNELNIIKYA